MAYATQALDSFVTSAGTLTITLYYDDTISIVFPDSFMPIVSFEDTIEKCEETTGLIEIPTMGVELAEVYTDIHPEGIWYAIIAATIDGDLPPPELRFVLENGAAYSIPFWGTFDLNSVEFVEHYVGSTYVRTVNAQLVSSIYRVAKIDFDDYLTNLLAARGVEELPIVKPAPSGIYTGAAGIITFGYRVAARDADREYAWSNEVLVTDCDDLAPAGNHIDLSWSAVAGATSYSIYRTTVSSGPLSTGFLGNQVGASFIDDGVAAAAGTTQTKLSARKFVKYSDFFRYAVVEGFGVAYGAGLVPNMTDDVRMKVGAASLSAETEWFEYWWNTGNITTPVMSLTPYFDSTNSEYFGNRYESVLDLLGALSRQFAHYPRFYDAATSAVPTPTPRVDLLARRQSLTTIVLDGQLEESSLWAGSQFVRRSIASSRARHKNSRYSTNEGISQYDLDIPCEFAVTTAASLPNLGFEQAEYEGIYWVTTGATPTASLADGAEYYSGTGWVAAGATTFLVRMEDGVEVGIKTPLQAALVIYFQALTDRRARMYERTYYGISSTTGGVSSEKNTIPLAKVVLSDGLVNHNYYVNEARKNLFTSSLWLRLIQQ
jgi:hypothetical protein